ncbi:MAG TPA: NFACT family protein [Pyrinomonadaceae bacterium]|nr:NFACT family protein [Pyrinomonadaceae bacterium]
MKETLIKSVAEELAPLVEGRAWGKVFQLSRASLAVDLRTGDGRYLLLSAEPNAPRLYMIARTVRELEKSSLPPSPFALALRKHLGGATVAGVSKDAGERVVRFSLDAQDEAGRAHSPTLVAQLTGRSANLFLLDDAGRVLDSLRPARGEGQETGEPYAPPATQDSTQRDAHRDAKRGDAQVARTNAGGPPDERGRFASLSEALDDFYSRRERERAFDARASAASARLRQAIEKRLKLRRNLERDREAHGDADEHKRLGDLLLANVATAERRGSVVRLSDYYTEGAPTIEIEIDEQRTLQEEAAARFSRYTKARRASEEMARRLETLTRELDALEALRARLQIITEAGDDAALEAFGEELRKASGEGARRRAVDERRADGGRKKAEGVPGVRRYRSTDGYEVMVGRAARDNDHLTFRVARPSDIWLHAADYPGSHVVVRNHLRGKVVPHRTVIEAAQLAAHFSQARKDAKVAVHYTERKFVSKIKGAAPGLVRLSSFRTLLVEPREALERM